MVKLILIFLILFFGILALNSSNNTTYERKRKRYIYLIASILTLFSGLRNWAVGSDTYQYFYLFDSVKYESWKDLINSFINFSGKDPFYKIFEKFFQIFSDSYQLYLCLVALIFMISLGNFIYKNTNRISHAILAFIIYMGYFYGFFSITGIRQTLATAFLLWSFEFIKQRKLVPFLLLVLVASLFHITALVFLPLYFIANIKKTKLLFVLSLISFPFVMVFKNVLAPLLVNYFGVEDRFGVYAEQYERGGSLILTTFHILLALISILIIKKILKITPQSRLMYSTYALALFFLPLQWVNPNAGRISQYFAVIIMVWIPFLIDALGNNNFRYTRPLYTFTILIFIVLTLFTINSWDEYKFFWQYMPIPY